MENRIEKRSRKVRDGGIEKGPVVYWMSREQRTSDNWALLYAQRRALELKVPLAVIFCVSPSFIGATLRQYDFMLRGLAEVADSLKKKNIAFAVTSGDPAKKISHFVNESHASLLVIDFDPLKIKRLWRRDVIKRTKCEIVEVDSRNIVPCWIASPKQEYGAYTIRPKIMRIIDDYMDEFPSLKKHPFGYKKKFQKFDIRKLFLSIRVDKKVKPVKGFKPGERAAKRALQKFITGKLGNYDKDRNDPSLGGQSELSPYLHFGQLSSLRVALNVKNKVFLEELIVRRELADNFCYYNDKYDSAASFPKWAAESLAEHKKDHRVYRYSLKTLESAKTHDKYWNAAQMEMVKRGKMHGYMRMYWAKKILEWTPSADKAVKFAIYLNDKYELDGRDPNGYAGIAWAIGGVHDRPWFERPIFGKVRYMSAGGLKSKFDMEKYCSTGSPPKSMRG